MSGNEVSDKTWAPLSASQMCASEEHAWSEPCTKHPGEILDFYCESHNELVCSVCVTSVTSGTSGHITCEVEYIHELAKGIVSSKEYETLVKDIDYFQEYFEKTKEKCEESIDDVEKRSEAYTDEVKHLGEAIIKHTRDLMQRAVDEKDEIVKEILAGLRGSQEQTKKMIKEINSMNVALESKQNSDNESFVLMKKLLLNITEANETLGKRQIDSKPTVFQFAKNPDIKHVQEIQSFGTLSKRKKVVEQLDDISISTESDNIKPVISGLELLSDGRLAMVDNKNKTVKLIDTKDTTVTEIKLQHKPWDLSEVNKGQLAVTLPHDGKIQFLSVTGSAINTTHSINTDQFCYGVAAHENNLIVGFVPGQVQLMDMTGRVLRRIIDEHGERLFSSPWYVVVNPSNDMIYLSDNSNKTLTCMTMEGKVEFVNSYVGLKGRNGLAIGEDGSVYVCGGASVHHITREGTSIQELLGSEQEGAYSMSIAYDKHTGKIYLGSVAKSLKVYRLG